MMPLRRFTIDQPKTVKEAAEMLSQYGENGRLYAGGTELLLAMKHDLLRYEHLVDVKGLPGLNAIEIVRTALRIGATATHRAIEKSATVRENLPVLADMAHHVANVRVRATGTLGGNLCFAEPHSDPATLLLALEAHAHVEGKGGERKLDMDELITGAYETALAPDEVLTEIRLGLPNGRSGSTFVELARRHGDFALAGVAALVSLGDDGTVADARLALIGVGDRAVRARAAEAVLRGERPSAELFAEAAEAVDTEIRPGGDIHASERYRRHIAGVLTRRALATAVKRAGGDANGEA